MATWTNITDAALEPGRPIRSVDGLALRDNAIAIAEGAVGAPLIDGTQAPAIRNGGIPDGEVGSEKLQTGTAERDWVLARTATATAGAVGSYALAAVFVDSDSDFNSTRSGSQLLPSTADGSRAGSSLSGSWRCMGRTVTSGTDADKATLWLRIS